MLDRMAISLMENLKAKGIDVISIEPESDQTDPTLYITDKVHIQVGYGYVNVVRQEDSAFRFLKTNGHINDIMLKLKEAIK